MKQIDLNCDAGEIAPLVTDGTQTALFRHISSANIACGGHAGNAEMMRATIRQALDAGIAIGAHPGYEDAANFGRIELQFSPEEIAAFVHRQLIALDEIAKPLGARIGHVKPHGALYNQAARDFTIAQAIATGVTRWRTDDVLVGLANSVMIEVFRKAGFRAAGEAFADRRYEPDGSLRSRKFGDALLGSPEAAAEQALRVAQNGSVISFDRRIVPLDAQTICIHGDTPNAPQFAAAVNATLRETGILVHPLASVS
jgi:UPF0271 protein